MLINYIVVAVRNLVKDKLYTSINALGLAVAFTTCFFIYSWVRFESSYDVFEGNESVYRLATGWDDEPAEGYATTYPMVRTRVLPQFPEIEESVRVFNTGFLGSKTRITYLTHINTNSVLYYADSTFFRVFPVKFLQGMAETALSKPNAIVLSQSLAASLFESENPIGKLVVIGKDKAFEVTGVVTDLPYNSHLHFDMIASMQSHPWIREAEQNVWSGISFHTYVKLKEGSSPNDLQQKINAYLDHFPNDPDGQGKSINAILQPVASIHLTSHLKHELTPPGDEKMVYIFITVAVLVLVMAVVNYINLATARHTQRFREVGVRKVMGANRSQLVLQFTAESIMVSFMAITLAILMTELCRPALAYIADEKFFSIRFYHKEVLLLFFAGAILIGIISGLFPAFVLSGIKPVKLFKPSFDSALKGSSLRKGLVIFQFTVSIILTICTAITFQQIRFIRSQPAGYDRGQVVALNIGYSGVKDKYKTLKAKIEGSSSVLYVACTSQLPTDVQTFENIDLPGGRTAGAYYMSVDPEFFTALNITLLSGNNELQAVIPNDSIHSFAMNESALQSIGWTPEQAVGSKMSIRHGNQQPGPVVAIIKDFHFQSLHATIQPLIVEFTPGSYEFMLIKVQTDHVRDALQAIEAAWKEVAGGIPFDFSFLDEDYNALYKQEQLTGSLFVTFSFIALIIALLGLFGLASFAVTKRAKEIGIRRILGAEINGILKLLSKDFGYLLIIASVVSIPAGLYFRHEWLESFAYQTQISPWLFILASLLNILLALLTIAYHGIRATRINPVETLRSE